MPRGCLVVPRFWYKAQKLLSLHLIWPPTLPIRTAHPGRSTSIYQQYHQLVTNLNQLPINKRINNLNLPNSVGLRCRIRHHFESSNFESSSEGFPSLAGTRLYPIHPLSLVVLVDLVAVVTLRVVRDVNPLSTRLVSLKKKLVDVHRG